VQSILLLSSSTFSTTTSLPARRRAYLQWSSQYHKKNTSEASGIILWCWKVSPELGERPEEEHSPTSKN